MKNRALLILLATLHSTLLLGGTLRTFEGTTAIGQKGVPPAPIWINYEFELSTSAPAFRINNEGTVLLKPEVRNKIDEYLASIPWAITRDNSYMVHHGSDYDITKYTRASDRSYLWNASMPYRELVSKKLKEYLESEMTEIFSDSNSDLSISISNIKNY